MSKMKTVLLPSGKKIPILGQGTWSMGESDLRRSDEIAALNKGIDLGLSVIDTAEIYSDGLTEELIGEVTKKRRKEVYLVTKVNPQNATRIGTIKACEKSLQRLQTDYIDLYLLHWRGSIPLQETFEAFKTLKQAGKILDYGVSNFDVNDMEEATSIGANEIVINQVLYNLSARNIEWDLIPWCEKRGIPIMAYSPFGHDRQFLENRILNLIASRHGATPAQIALSWILRQNGIVAIPKASNIQHVLENYQAILIQLSEEDLNELDRAFPPPRRKGRLPVI